MQDEGYIKFQIHREEAPAPVSEELFSLRQRAYEAGLIGVYPDGVGFGNASVRHPLPKHPHAFLITATATGGFKRLSANDVVLVKDCRPETNEVWCRGLKNPSSESMTHHVVYRCLPQVQRVLHAHHRQTWEKLLRELPHTPADVPYGTPAMARAVEELLQNPLVLQAGRFAMAGHEEGVVFFW